VHDDLRYDFLESGAVYDDLRYDFPETGAMHSYYLQNRVLCRRAEPTVVVGNAKVNSGTTSTEREREREREPSESDAGFLHHRNYLLCERCFSTVCCRTCCGCVGKLEYGHDFSLTAATLDAVPPHALPETTRWMCDDWCTCCCC
jgi:hypothetical protein